MAFFDEARITVISGKGGNGCASFRREKMRHLLHKISKFRRVSGRPQISVYNHPVSVMKSVGFPG